MNFFITNREKCKKAQKPERFLCFFCKRLPIQLPGDEGEGHVPGTLAVDQVGDISLAGKLICNPPVEGNQGQGDGLGASLHLLPGVFQALMVDGKITGIEGHQQHARPKSFNNPFVKIMWEFADKNVR